MSKFVCPGCGKTADAGTDCCGKPMVAGNFQCKTCGKIASSSESCCGKSMSRI